jgi:anti-sigma B factor antagonist
MGEFQRIHVSDVDNVSVVRFTDRKILDELIIQDLGQELFSLVGDDRPRKLLLNFTNVDSTKFSGLPA